MRTNPMTVAEFIEVLKKLPPDAPVVGGWYANEIFEADDIYLSLIPDPASLLSLTDRPKIPGLHLHLE